jgi:putative transposase
MITSQSIRLYPNNEQATYFRKACGVSRFAYNWGLARWNQWWQDKRDGKVEEYPTEAAIRKELNAIKREQFPWMLEVTKCAPQQAIRNLGAAWKRHVDHKRGKGPRSGKPRFKRRKDGEGSFYLDNTSFKLSEGRIAIPNLGWVRMAEDLRFPAVKFNSCTIRRKAGQWYASVSYETQVEPAKVENQDVVGVDLGIKALATLSTGEVVEGPKAYARLQGRLARLQRSASRKAKGSANRRKANFKVARLHKRIADRRSDALHKLTTRLARTYGVIVVEDLNVAGMVKNHCLAKSLADQSFGEFRRQLEYKVKARGGAVVVVDKFFPSTKMCSNCGCVKQTMPLSERVYACDACGFTKDRDLNAAINLAANSAASACGAGSSGGRFLPAVKLPTVKQEANTMVSHR